MYLVSLIFAFMCLGSALLEPGLRHSLEIEDRTGTYIPERVRQKEGKSKQNKWRHTENKMLAERDCMNEVEKSIAPQQQTSELTE